MMKETIVTCDICGKNITYQDKRYKFKRYNNSYMNYEDFEWQKWDKLDMCQECYGCFIHFINESKRSDNNAE